jgi:hypothetical protein
MFWMLPTRDPMEHNPSYHCSMLVGPRTKPTHMNISLAAAGGILARTLEVPKRDQSLLAALDELPVAIYVTNADAVITYYKPACIAFAGRVPMPGRDRCCVAGSCTPNTAGFLCPMAEANAALPLPRTDRGAAPRSRMCSRQSDRAGGSGRHDSFERLASHLYILPRLVLLEDRQACPSSLHSLKCPARCRRG